MGVLRSTEQAAVERAAAEPMLAQVEAWAEVNSGTGNLDGLATVAGLLADEFSGLPGTIELEDAAQVEAVEPDGSKRQIGYGRNLHLAVRPGTAYPGHGRASRGSVSAGPIATPVRRHAA